MKDALGDRMKMYEQREAHRLCPLLPVIARVDGRSFHSFTKGMKRPFDKEFTNAMIATTIGLVKETGACIGYTQSDEITLIWHSTDIRSQIWFDCRVQKMVSQLGAQATLMFYRECLANFPQFAGRMPTFDARVWSVPNQTEACNVLLWREWDATKNSLTMAASEHFSHKDLMNKNSKAKHDMLHSVGVNWNDYPVAFKRGTYVQRMVKELAYTASELCALPPKHKARSDPTMKVMRSVVEAIDMPIFSKVLNKDAVVFLGASPITDGA